MTTDGFSKRDAWAGLAAPLAYSLLGQLETAPVVRLDIGEFFGFDPENPLPELTIEEVARSFGPLEEYSAPDQHSERVNFYDVAGRRSVSLNANQTITIELVRQAVPVESVAIIQRIGTWLRVGVPGDAEVFFEFYDGNVGPGATAVGTPYPFPWAVPVAGGTLSVTYTLIRERIPDAGRALPPAMLGPSLPQLIPNDTPILSPWTDQRYGWNTTFAESLYYVTGDRSLLRLFATISQVAGGAGRLNVQIAGRLAGSVHITGYRKAALEHAIFRH